MSQSTRESFREVVVSLDEKKSIRILHVDDEAALLKIAKKCLEMEGPFQVEVVSSVEEALEKIKTERYDAIISDYQMPGKDGLDFLKELRGSGSRVPFILFTGKGREEVAVKALNLGADHYLNKNGNPETVYCELAHATIEAVERKKAEERLKKQNAELFAIIENTGDSIWSLDTEGRLIFTNSTFKRMFHLTYGVELQNGMKLKEYIPSSEESFWVEKHSRALKGEHFSFEQNVEIKGKQTDFEISVNPIVRDGEVLGATYFSRDITERKRIVASEQTLKTFFEYAPDGVYVNDLKGNLIDGNKAAEEITGFKREELIGKNFLKLGMLPKKEILKAVALLAKNALGKPTGPDEITLRRKDGKIINVEIRTFPVRLQDRTVVLGIARNITDRLRAQKEITESQARFKALFKDNPEAGVFLSTDFLIEDINPKFGELFGYSLEEIKDRHIDEVIVPADKKDEAQTLDDNAVNGYASHNTLRRRKDGSFVPVSISAAPVRSRGDLLGYVGVYKDISDLKETEKKLETMNEKLQVVGGLTRHDVRNKLFAITGNAYLLKKQFADKPDVLDKLREMENAVELTVNIFNFAKAYEMLGVEELNYVDVARTFDEAVSLFSDKITVQISNECNGLDVLADSLLRQLFYNLIDNSIKHGKKVTKIKVSYEKTPEGKLKLLYEDDGVGIPAADKPKLFRQGYSTGGSTGYGLYMISKMLEVYGWRILETGEPAKSAQFVMIIPSVNMEGKEHYRIRPI